MYLEKKTYNLEWRKVSDNPKNVVRLLHDDTNKLILDPWSEIISLSLESQPNRVGDR